MLRYPNSGTARTARAGSGPRGLERRGELDPIWTGAGNWQADAGQPTYPARWTIPVTTPGSYRHYRVYADSWTNGSMVVCNLSLYE